MGIYLPQPQTEPGVCLKQAEIKVKLFVIFSCVTLIIELYFDQKSPCSWSALILICC